MKKNKLSVVAISDTHHKYWELDKLPKADVLVHAGDIGLWEEKDLIDFSKWLKKQKQFKHKIIIPGNHDKYAYFQPRRCVEILFEKTGASLLIDTDVVEEGFHFYGSPMTPEFNNWYFMADRGEEMKKVWAGIPKGIDVLITHGPRWGVLDSCNVTLFNKVGCEELGKRIDELKVPLHVFGHIHSAHGVAEINGTRYINCSVVDERYDVVYSPIVFDIERR